MAGLVLSSFMFVCVFFLFKFSKIRQRSCLTLPPIFHVSKDEMLNRPGEVYKKAFRDHGHIVGIQEGGTLRFIVDDTLTREVLTSEHMSFSEGAFAYLNVHFLHRFFPGYFDELEGIVRSCMADEMHSLVDKVGPVVMDQATSLMRAAKTANDNTVDFADHARKAISRALAVIMFGSNQLDQQDFHIIEKLEEDLTVATGLYSRCLWGGGMCAKLGQLWRGFKMVIATIPRFYYMVSIQLRRRLQAKHTSYDGKTENYENCALDYLVRRFASVDGRIGVKEFVKVSGLLIGMVFASVHLTASVSVWVIYELATKREYLPILLEEMHSLSKIDPSTNNIGTSFDRLRDAHILDSFIREVLRTAGEAQILVRLSTSDVLLGGYTIPKGHMVIVHTSSSHFSTKYHSSNAAGFDGTRWVSTDKRAVTVSSSYLPFGLGRFSCPGRVLAVTEIKMVVWSIICRATPVLHGNTYRVLEPLHGLAVPPGGKLQLLLHDP